MALGPLREGISYPGLGAPALVGSQSCHS